MKQIAYLLAGLAMAACQPNNEFTLTGTFPQPFSGTVYLSYIQAGHGITWLDSLTLDNATEFRLQREIERPDRYRIITSPRNYDAEFIAEPQSEYKIDFTEKANYYTPVQVVKGGSEQALMNEYTQIMDQMKQEVHALNKVYQQKMAEKTPQGKAQADSITQELSNLFVKREEVTKDFILQHARSYVACQLAGDLLIYTYPELEKLYTNIDTTAYAYSQSYHSFKKKYNEAKRRWIQGSPAPDFTTHDLKGKEVKLSDFRGQYVLLDFWASWCHPCRKRAAELKAIYPELQARGITVCGLSMDEKKEQWAAATREDGIIWTNTGEVKPFKDNTIAADYKVNQLPTMFLIDPEGIVVMQNPEIADLLKLPVKN